MVADGTYSAVLDRFEGDLAVLIIEADGKAIDDLVVPTTELPPDGHEVDTVFEVEVADGELVSTTLDQDTTEERAEQA